ncbi:MAG: UDP-N-acetylmuramoyl-L-alanyl-D-glutamate--2,6-diaminopimelate ligase [Endomicrobium sp.]|jgi:UDP-N-acetylmuramoyl-L-alanyl-D-glutamate--2,6-diaminopimelate ligase|nr:UDP-N-acetylmuramoyl-L-alanyl-D-glutamate--2,6-diaminopimelate ligase [Endomicrobium sp.]
MKLYDILNCDKINNFKMIVIGYRNIDISNVSYTSKTVSKNCAFFALPGYITNGAKYINEAINNGASVIITTLKCDVSHVVQIIVKDIFCFMSVFCAKFYNYPDKKLNIIGVTGTNGKTTVTYMIESIFLNVGIECCVIGTINYRYKGKILKAINTTPLSLDLYSIMRQIVDRGIKHLIMEVSSHALRLNRVYGINFNIAIFTNLTSDHLDFHKNIKNYYKVKSTMFKGHKNMMDNKKYAIINFDDKYGKKLLCENINAKIKLYSIIANNVVDFLAKNIKISNTYSKFNLVYGHKEIKIVLKNCIGLYNISNALAASAAAICSGIPLNKIAQGFDNLGQIPGRCEKISMEYLDFDIFVDYAHTKDALENVLYTLKEIKYKKIVTVFGCGGNRDKTKRPLMGKIATKMSDFVFITSDNSREEDPRKIILDIEIGIKKEHKKKYKVVVDREMAIKEAITMASKGDVVLIAGKGHETYQVIGREYIYFSDISIVKKYVYLKYNKN